MPPSEEKRQPGRVFRTAAGNQTPARILFTVPLAELSGSLGASLRVSCRQVAAPGPQSRRVDEKRQKEEIPNKVVSWLNSGMWDVKCLRESLFGVLGFTVTGSPNLPNQLQL